MPAPADLQTSNNGATAGRPEAGDTLVLTFAGTVNPDLVLGGWDGSTTTITVTAAQFASDDVLSFDSGGTALTALGYISLSGNYSNSISFTGSTMTASGSTVTIVLGTPSGVVHTVSSPTTMFWWAPTGWVFESGASDVEF